MPKQPAFPGLRDAIKKKQTRRELFLAEMDAVVPWGRFLALIEPHYPKAGPKGGRPQHGAAPPLRARGGSDHMGAQTRPRNAEPARHSRRAGNSGVPPDAQGLSDVSTHGSDLRI